MWKAKNSGITHAKKGIKTDIITEPLMLSVKEANTQSEFSEGMKIISLWLKTGRSYLDIVPIKCLFFSCIIITSEGWINIYEKILIVKGNLR